MEWKYEMPSNIEMENAERFKEQQDPLSEVGSVVNIYAQAVAALGERLAYWQEQRTVKTTKIGDASVTIDVRGIPELQETLTKLKTAVEVAEMERDNAQVALSAVHELQIETERKRRVLSAQLRNLETRKTPGGGGLEAAMIKISELEAKLRDVETRGNLKAVVEKADHLHETNDRLAARLGDMVRELGELREKRRVESISTYDRIDELENKTSDAESSKNQAIEECKEAERLQRQLEHRLAVAINQRNDFGEKFADVVNRCEAAEKDLRQINADFAAFKETQEELDQSAETRAGDWQVRAETAEALNTTLVEERRAVLKGQPDPEHPAIRFRSGDQWFEMCLPRRIE